jgi:hypothetical protein
MPSVRKRYRNMETLAIEIVNDWFKTHHLEAHREAAVNDAFIRQVDALHLCFSNLIIVMIYGSYRNTHSFFQTNAAFDSALFQSRQRSVLNLVNLVSGICPNLTVLTLDWMKGQNFDWIMRVTPAETFKAIKHLQHLKVPQCPFIREENSIPVYALLLETFRTLTIRAPDECIVQWIDAKLFGMSQFPVWRSVALHTKDRTGTNYLTVLDYEGPESRLI